MPNLKLIYSAAKILRQWKTSGCKPILKNIFIQKYLEKFCLKGMQIMTKVFLQGQRQTFACEKKTEHQRGAK